MTNITTLTDRAFHILTTAQSRIANGRRQLAADIAATIAALEKAWACVETNSGTYSGSPRDEYFIEVEVGSGRRRVRGADPESAPGYARTGGVATLRRAERALSELRALYTRIAESSPSAARVR